MSIEQRKYPRVLAGWPVFLDGGNGTVHKIKLANISVAGLGLQCELNMRQGMKLKLTVVMPNERLHEPPVHIPVEATVVHAIIEGNFCRVGATIDRIDNAHLDMFKRHIERNRL